ncbi:MAG: hypothetical protein ACOYB2_10705 [Limnohabitans sp.]
MATKKITLNGQEHDCVEVPFEVKSEPWCEYELLDGGRLRVRNIVVRVWMVLGADGKPLLNADGDPTVIANTQTVNVVLSR